MKKFYLAILTLSLVYQNSIFAQDVDFEADSVCLGERTRFVANTKIADSLITGYFWDLDNSGQFKEMGSAFLHAYLTADTFLVSLKIRTTNDTIEMEEPKEVIVYPVPQANFHVDNLCEGQTALFTDQTYLQYGTIDKYYWDFDNNGSHDDITSGANASFDYGGAGTYTARLTVYSNKNCNSFTTKTVKVNPNPNASFSVQGNCADIPITFVNSSAINSGKIDIYKWDFGDGSLDNTTGNASHTYTTDGDYAVTLIAITDNNCSDTVKNVNVSVMSSPDLTLNYPDSIIYPGEEMILSASGDYTAINWSTGEITDSITVTDSGHYSVEVTNSNGCKSEASVYVHFASVGEEDEKILIKNNIITPNGDGINDYFVIKDLSFFTTCKLIVYNLYGDIVFEQSNYDNTWEANELDPGTYYYIISCDNSSKTGTINILK